jgi:predicted ribosomally synthesized peptide with SipW-like signal peptide
MRAGAGLPPDPARRDPIYLLEEGIGKMKKSVLIGLLVLSLAALLAVGGTMAWFTAEADPVTNQFTAGTVEIEINEVYTEELNWNPGSTTNKEISVKTLGSKCVYVRVSLTPVWGHLVGEVFTPDPSLPINNVVLNWKQDGWVYDDGWYYYKRILCPEDEETSLLLQSVTLEDGTGNEYQGKFLQIVVNAEAVQASHDAYKSVWGLATLPEGVED